LLGLAPSATFSAYQSLVHSSTFPLRSRTPKTLAPCGCVPTRAGRLPQLLWPPSLASVTAAAQLVVAPPDGYRTADTPRAANSHSASRGRRFPANRQYASAS